MEKVQDLLIFELILKVQRIFAFWLLQKRGRRGWWCGWGLGGYVTAYGPDIITSSWFGKLLGLGFVVVAPQSYGRGQNMGNKLISSFQNLDINILKFNLEIFM